MREALTLKAQPLTAQAFAPFGDVLEIRDGMGEPMNQGWAERFRDLATLDIADAGGRADVSLVRSRADELPVRLRLLERHPLGSQIFMPLGANPFLVVVGAAGAVPARDQLQAFISNGRQGVNYHKGVWHHPMIALAGYSDFIVIDRAGPGDNCDESEIPGGAVDVRR